MNRDCRCRTISLVTALWLLLGWSILTNAVPVARFNCDSCSTTSGLEVCFDGSSSQDPDGRIVQYQWSFGDGRYDSGEVVVHRYGADGDYPVTLTVLDNHGAQDMRSLLVRVSDMAGIYSLGLTVGQNAPESVLLSLDGVPVSIKDYRGRVVVLDFWESHCAPCRKTLPRLQELCKRYEGQGLVLVSVTIDPYVDDATRFLQDNGLTNLLVLWGSFEGARAVKSLYGVGAIPYIFVVDRDGVIRYSGKPEDLTDGDLTPWL